MNSSINIILADDHKLFREGIRALLQKYDDFVLVGEAENGHELLDRVKKLRPDVALVDISMPGLSGIDSIPLIKEEEPAVKIIILTMHEDGNYIFKSIEAGASSYLMKNVDEDELVRAIRKVAEGEKYFSPRVSALMIEEVSKAKKEELINLTEREKEILKLVADGLSTKMIAEKLFLSTRTVETHRVNIMKKLKAQNTAELVKKASDLNLI